MNTLQVMTQMSRGWNDLIDLEEEDDEEELELLLSVLSPTRASALYRQRWNDEYLVNLAQHEGSFVAEYRVDAGGFDLLHELLGERLQKNEEMARRSSGTSGSDPISSASRLGAGLIFLAGGRGIEAMRTHGISQSTAYGCLHDVVAAVNDHPQLAIVCDNSLEALQERATAFHAKSSHGLFEYCTGAIDGLAIAIQAPSAKDTSNQRRFYSTTKDMYCINTQLVSDAYGRILAFSAKHVGSTNDAPAFDSSDLKPMNESLEFPYHWVGDNAYPLTETMMTPFAGLNLHMLHPEQEGYNFFQSQMRIIAEQCNGMLIQRFGILWKPLRFDLHFAVQIIHACCRLHNFCLNRNLPVLNEKYAPPCGLLSAVQGAYRVHGAGQQGAAAVRSGNTLRDDIVKEVLDKRLFRVRSHNV
jgi:AcrR family transcriptional regulator